MLKELGRLAPVGRIWLAVCALALACRAELPPDESGPAGTGSDGAALDAPDVDAAMDAADADTPDGDASIDAAGLDAPDVDATTDAASMDAPDVDATTDAAGADALDADAATDTASVDAPDVDAATDTASVDAPDIDATTDAADVDAANGDASTDTAGADAPDAAIGTDAAGVDAPDADATTDTAGADTPDADVGTDAAALDAPDAPDVAADAATDAATLDVDTGPGPDTAQPPKCSANSCDDGKVCTQDSCDPLLGCSHAPKSGPCDDGDACTGGDQCSASACAGTAKNCEDGNTCTVDSCDKTAGCQNKAASGACDDGDNCSISDTCSGGKCVAGAAKTCNDGSPCSQDSCAKGACVFKPVPCQAAPCLASSDCATGKCDAAKRMCVLCLGHGDCGKDAPVCTSGLCQAGVLCKGALDCKGSLQVCDMAAGACVDCLADGDCSGGTVCVAQKCVVKQACNSDKQCLNAAQPICVGGSCVSCGPGAPCPAGELCDAAGACQPSLCDGFACSATLGAFGCESGKAYAPPKVCNDGNPCTGDDCSTKSGCANPLKPDGSSCQLEGACPFSGCKAGQCTSLPLAGEATFTLGPPGAPGNVYAVVAGSLGGVVGLATVSPKLSTPAEPWLFALSQSGKLLWKTALAEPAATAWVRAVGDGNGGIWAVSSLAGSPAVVKLWHYDSSGAKVGGFDLTGHLDSSVSALAGDASRAWVGGSKSGVRQLGHLSASGQWTVAAYPAPPNATASDLRSLAMHPDGLVVASGHSQNSASYNYLEIRSLDNLQSVLASKAEPESNHSNTQLAVVGTQVVEKVLVSSGNGYVAQLRRFDSKLLALGSVTLPTLTYDWRIAAAGQLGLVALAPGNVSQGIQAGAQVVAYDISGNLVWNKAIGVYYDGVLAHLTVSGGAPVLVGNRSWPNPSIRALRLAADGSSACPCVAEGKSVGTCDDVDPCTLDSCGAKGCAHTPAAEGSACDDGHPYTPTSTCQVGKCKAPCSQMQLGANSALTWTVAVDAAGNARGLASQSGQAVAYKLDAAGKETAGAPFAAPPATGVAFEDGSWLLGGYVNNGYTIVPVAPNLAAGAPTVGFNGLQCNSVSPTCTATSGVYALYCLNWNTGMLQAHLANGSVAWDAGALVVAKTGNLGSRLAHTGTCGEVILCAEAEAVGGQAGDVIVRKLDKGVEKWKTTVSLGKVDSWWCGATAVAGSTVIQANTNVGGSTVNTMRLVQSNGVTFTWTHAYPNVTHQVVRLWGDGAGNLGAAGSFYPNGWGLSAPLPAAFAFDNTGAVKSKATLALPQPFVLPALHDVRYVGGDIVAAGAVAYSPTGLAGQSLARWTFPKMSAPVCQ